VVLLALPGPLMAQGTPTPSLVPSATLVQRMYNRTDLLTQIGPRAVNATAAFSELQLPSTIVDTLASGGQWYLTFDAILANAGVYAFIAGILMLMMIIYWSRRKLVEMTDRPQIADQKRQDQEMKRFRKDFRKFRTSVRRRR
jgi:hypothetical protein